MQIEQQQSQKPLHFFVDILIIFGYILSSSIVFPLANVDTYFLNIIFYHSLMLVLFVFFYKYDTFFKSYFFTITFLVKKNRISKKRDNQKIITLILVSICCTIVLILLSKIIQYILYKFIYLYPAEKISKQATLPNNPILAIVFLIVAAIREELFYRNYLLKLGSRLHLPLSISIIISTTIFSQGHFHQGLHGGIFAFVGGILFCIVFVTYKSMLSTIAIHAMYNVLLFLLSSTFY